MSYIRKGIKPVTLLGRSVDRLTGIPGGYRERLTAKQMTLEGVATSWQAAEGLLRHMRPADLGKIIVERSLPMKADMDDNCALQIPQLL